MFSSLCFSLVYFLVHFPDLSVLESKVITKQHEVWMGVNEMRIYTKGAREDLGAPQYKITRVLAESMG